MARPDFFQSISISSHFHFFYASFFFLIQFFLSNCPDLLLRIFLPFFFLIAWHSTTVGSVVELFVVTVPPRSSSSLPSLQNHCECVTTAIMFYQVARPSQIKSQRKKVSWMWFVSIVFLCSGNWKGKQWMLNCRGNFYQPINEESFIWWSCIISPDQAMFQPKKSVNHRHTIMHDVYIGVFVILYDKQFHNVISSIIWVELTWNISYVQFGLSFLVVGCILHCDSFFLC